MSKWTNLISRLGRNGMFTGGKMGKDETIGLADIGIKGKIFCLSMQRSGTSSVGDFLQQWGLVRAGHQLSRKQLWSLHWYNGNYDAIFSDPEFQRHEVYEDDPFWCPEFYKYVYHKVPDSRFILLNRDSDAWFKSMIRHSYGYSLGHTEIHAKVYRREDELIWLEKNIPGFKGASPKAMVLYDKPAHYKATYERHIAEVQKFFSVHNSEVLFVSDLSDPDTWSKLKEWLGLPDKDGANLNVHTHKGRGEFTRADLLSKN